MNHEWPYLDQIFPHFCVLFPFGDSLIALARNKVLNGNLKLLICFLFHFILFFLFYLAKRNVNVQVSEILYSLIFW